MRVTLGLIALVAVVVVVGIFAAMGNEGLTGATTTILDAVCYQDADCDDNDSTTDDICRHPGTMQAECLHLPLEE